MAEREIARQAGCRIDGWLDSIQRERERERERE